MSARRACACSRVSMPRSFRWTNRPLLRLPSFRIRLRQGDDLPRSQDGGRGEQLRFQFAVDAAPPEP
jgi:hypothetical protein